MTDTSFLSYFPDPFDVKDSRYFLCDHANICYEINCKQLSEISGQIVTYELPALLDDIHRAGAIAHPGLIDIGDAIKLKVGRSRDEGGAQLWNIWKNLAKHFDSPEEANRFESIVRSKTERTDSEVVVSLLAGGARALNSLWKQIISELSATGELARFTAVEIPIQQIFHYRQSKGISVDRDIAGTLLKEVANEKYVAYAKVSDALGRSASGLTFWNIHKYLGKTDAADLVDEIDGGRLRERFKIAAQRSTFARDFLTYSEADRDEVVLRRTIGPNKRIYPVFLPFGTVTGRILVSDPFLQQLRRKYRGVIAPDTGKKLVYLDYCQFEPGILAFLSNDQALIQSYNEGDLYNALSLAIYGSADYRAISKRIFLAYSYGMTTERISSLLLGAAAKTDAITRMQSLINAFFSVYVGLEYFRINMQEALLRDGFVSSLFGNKRWRNNGDTLSAKEKRWALNQPVQATASLILKEAIIAIDAEFGKESIVLPVHDAVLLQFSDDNSFEVSVKKAERIMLDAYSARCPGILPRVSIGSFHG